MPFDVGELLREIGDIAFVWLPIMMFALIIYLLWRTLSLMPRVKTTHVKPTSRSSVTWEEVAGLDEAKKELREVVDFLRHPKRFSRLGARVPKGILLYGPPGTGKTLLAKAVAHESGASFYSQSASAFVEMFAGPRRRHASASSSSRRRTTLQRSSSSTSSTPSAWRAWAAASTGSRTRR